MRLFMKKIQLIHNPTAGNGKHDKESLLQSFSKFSGEIQYIATSESQWRDFAKKSADVIYVAGGDGTVRKVADALFKHNLPREVCPPIGVIALGTANNIAETLGLSSFKEQIEVNSRLPLKAFDCGLVKGVAGEDFFMESFGVGILPELIKRAKDQDVSNEDQQKELQDVLHLLHDIVKAYDAQKATIKVNGFTIKGSFLLIEVMNIRTIGPNIELAPNADPGDGFFDLILIPQSKRAELLEYVNRRIKGEVPQGGLQDFASCLRLKDISLKWKNPLLHIDDILVTDFKGGKIKMRVLPKALAFLQK